MAYSKTPQVSTYETKRVSFITNPENRGVGYTDMSLTNLMVDVVVSGSNKKAFLKNRPGLSSYTSYPLGEGRGIFIWKNYGIEIHVISSSVYLNGNFLFALSTTTGQVGFAEHVDDSAQHTLLMVDGISGFVFQPDGSYLPCIPNSWVASTAYVIGAAVSPVVKNGYCYDCTTAGTTAATEPSWPTTVGTTVSSGTATFTCREQAFPSPHVPQPVFLDGYMFLAKKNTQDIQNCDLNKPLHWSAGNFVTAEMYPDTVVSLAKNNNMIYGVGQGSIQFFYDNANPTGTPLINNPGTVIQFGTPAPASVVQTEQEVILVGDAGAGGRSVWKIDGFKATEIGIPAVCQFLDNEKTNISSAIGTCIRILGQKLYILSLSTTTWVYSFTTGFWSQWSSLLGNFLAAYSTENDNGQIAWLGKTNGRVYGMSMDSFLDEGIPYPCTLITPKLDFDTINRKFMSRLSLIADVPTSSITQQIFVSWSDDDYKTWTPARSFLMSADLPSIQQLGSFRRRAFSITYGSGAAFRMEGIEVDINKGVK